MITIHTNTHKQTQYTAEERIKTADQSIRAFYFLIIIKKKTSPTQSGGEMQYLVSVTSDIRLQEDGVRKNDVTKDRVAFRNDHVTA
jgi:hypothetical protein